MNRIKIEIFKKHTYKLIKSYVIWSTNYFPVALYEYKLENITWKKVFVIYT